MLLLSVVKVATVIASDALYFYHLVLLVYLCVSIYLFILCHDTRQTADAPAYICMQAYIYIMRISDPIPVLQHIYISIK